MERGWLKAESLIDCSVDLEFIADLNDMIDISDENSRLMQEASK